MNSSGVEPLWDLVCIFAFDEEEETMTPGGIVVPKTISDKDKKANISARVVELGPLAFEDTPDRCPCEEDVVLIERYAGRFYKGKDGKIYRMVKDTDILGICDGEWDVRYAA